MLAALVIVFREAFEAGLIVGIVMAATRGVRGRDSSILAGLAVGVAGAGVMAMFAGAISNAFDGVGQELLNAAVLLVAVAMLTWHNVWMARHGRELAARMKEAGDAVAAGVKPLVSLSVVVALAVLREGFEIVLFLFGVVASDGAGPVALGGAFGLGLAGLVVALTYFGLLAIPPRLLFAATSALIALLAAGMAAQAVAFLDQANIFALPDAVVWDSSAIVPNVSLLGRVLHALMGYTERPTAMQVAAFIATLAAMFALMKLVASPSSRSRT